MQLHTNYILLAMTTAEKSTEKMRLYEELEKELQETIITVTSANSSHVYATEEFRDT